MRFAQKRVSSNKGTIKHHNHSPNARLESQRSYIHYNNAIYMGGVTSFKRNGQGFLLMDDGTSVISEYCFDSMTGHNVIFREDCIVSMLFLKNGHEVAVRTGQYVLKMSFNVKEEHPNGSGVLVDYQAMKVYHLLFQAGKVVRKIAQTNRRIIDQVMHQELRPIMDHRHQQALKLNLKMSSGMKLLREGKKVTIGFIDNRHHLQGVGFKLRLNQHYDDFTHPLELKCVERGLYIRNRLQNFGERYFSNGNLYIGQFQDDLFEGEGVLLYPQEEKWVFGVFEGQRLKKMLAANLDSQGSKTHSIRSCLKQIHELNIKNWISSDIFLLEWSTFTAICREAFDAQVTDVVIEKERAQRQEQERLSRIQEHFISEPPGNAIDKVVEEQLTRNRCSLQQVILEEYGSLKSKVLQIQPRNTENQQHWFASTPIHHNLTPTKVLTPSRSNNWKPQDSKSPFYLSKTIQRTTIGRGGTSPLKRFRYPTNYY